MPNGISEAVNAASDAVWSEEAMAGGDDGDTWREGDASLLRSGKGGGEERDVESGLSGTLELGKSLAGRNLLRVKRTDCTLARAKHCIFH